MAEASAAAIEASSSIKPEGEAPITDPRSKAALVVISLELTGRPRSINI